MDGCVSGVNYTNQLPGGMLYKAEGAIILSPTVVKSVLVAFYSRLIPRHDHTNDSTVMKKTRRRRLHVTMLRHINSTGHLKTLGCIIYLTYAKSNNLHSTKNNST